MWKPKLITREYINKAIEIFNNRMLYLSMFYGKDNIWEFVVDIWDDLPTTAKTKIISPAITQALSDANDELELGLQFIDTSGYDMIYPDNNKVEIKVSMSSIGWTGNRYSNNKSSKLLLIKPYITALGITHIHVNTVDLEDCDNTMWKYPNDRKENSAFSNLKIFLGDSCHFNFIYGSIDTSHPLRDNAREFLDRVVDDERYPVQMLAEEISDC